MLVIKGVGDKFPMSRHQHQELVTNKTDQSPTLSNKMMT